MFSASTTTFMTTVNPFKKFQSAAQEQKELPSGLVERESATTGGTPLPFRHASVKKPTPLQARSRTFTSPSLYATFEKSLHQDSETESRSRAVSSPEGSSFANSFMRTPLSPPQHRHWRPPCSPKTPIDPGCILPGPARTVNPFEITSVRASTLAGAPAWWCRHDKLVIFDGSRTDIETGVKKWITRTSKGLEASRKSCPKENVHIEVNCAHCRTMLGKDKWVYQARVCELSVCKMCKERCAKEQERKEKKRKEEEVKNRRDSFLAQGPPPEVHLPDKDLRKIHSEGHLRGTMNWSIDEILQSKGLSESTAHLDVPAKEVRRWQSQQQLQT
jgi:hypothetical protein